MIGQRRRSVRDEVLQSCLSRLDGRASEQVQNRLCGSRLSAQHLVGLLSRFVLKMQCMGQPGSRERPCQTDQEIERVDGRRRSFFVHYKCLLSAQVWA